jgi:hypothetical protein
MSLEKWIRGITTIAGQLPGAVTVISKYDQFSLYQPAIYRGAEPLLIVPLAVGLVATWFAHKFAAIAMWVLLPLLLVLTGSVFRFHFLRCSGSHSSVELGALLLRRRCIRSDFVPVLSGAALLDKIVTLLSSWRARSCQFGAVALKVRVNRAFDSLQID